MTALDTATVANEAERKAANSYFYGQTGSPGTARRFQADNFVSKNEDGSIDEIDDAVSGLENDYPLLRITRNQNGPIDVSTNNLQYWSKNSLGSVTVDILQTITTGTELSSRPASEQEILNAIGFPGQHFVPNDLNIYRVVWSGLTSGNWLIHPGPRLPYTGTYTVGCFAKLISGGAGGWFLDGITNQWGLVGLVQEAVLTGNYTYPALNAFSASGEVHFALPAIVRGKIDLDRPNPRWGFFPSMFGAHIEDYSI